MMIRSLRDQGYHGLKVICLFSIFTTIAACNQDKDNTSSSERVAAAGVEQAFVLASVNESVVLLKQPEQDRTQIQETGTDDQTQDSLGGEDDYRSIKAQIAVLDWGKAEYGNALIEPVPMFFGDVNGDGVDDVLAVIYAEVGVSGTRVEPTIFMNDAGEFVPYETLGPISGFEPRLVKMSYGQVALTTTVHIEGDASCCPSGAQSWTLDLDF